MGYEAETEKELRRATPERSWKPSSRPKDVESKMWKVLLRSVEPVYESAHDGKMRPDSD